jgi:hypothetical protein
MGLNADPRGTHKQLPVAIERSAGKAGQQSVIEQGSFFHQNGPSKNPTDLPKTAILQGITNQIGSQLRRNQRPRMSRRKTAQQQKLLPYRQLLRPATGAKPLRSSESAKQLQDDHPADDLESGHQAGWTSYRSSGALRVT